jgi:hypothetical protein
MERIAQMPAFLNRIGGFIIYTMVLEISLKIMLNIKVGLAGENPKITAK